MANIIGYKYKHIAFWLSKFLVKSSCSALLQVIGSVVRVESFSKRTKLKALIELRD